MSTATSTASFWSRLGVGQKISFIYIGFLAVLVVIMGYTVTTINAQKSDGVAIDLAGRQRLLTQRYTKEVLLAAQGIETNHAATLDLFKGTLTALIEGGPAVENPATGKQVVLPPSTLPDVRDSLTKQAALADALEQATQALLALPEGDPQRQEVMKQLLSDSTELLVTANDLVKRLTAQAEGKIQTMINWEFLITFLALGLGAFSAWFVVRSISAPLSDCVTRAQEIAEGNLAGNPLSVASKDEIGRLSDSFNEMLTALREIARETRTATEDLNAAGSEILATTQEQAAGTKEQAAAVQEITSTVEEINQSGVQVSERARQVASAAEAISATSASGLLAVQDTSGAMEAIREQAGSVAENVVSLSEKTQAIGEIITTVNDIAEQSNLVALNAAIEAADAGEEGRRFSVVANEIKNLADQAKEATGQVRKILEEIQKGINTSVMLTEEAVKRVEAGREKSGITETTMRKMASSIEDSVNAFQQIVGATNQQQIGLEQVTQALHEIRQTSQQTATSTGQMKEAADNLTDLGGLLRRLVEKYQL